MAACAVFLGTISGTLTLAREVVSDYELFSAAQVDAAQYAAQNLSLLHISEPTRRS